MRLLFVVHCVFDDWSFYQRWPWMLAYFIKYCQCWFVCCQILHMKLPHDVEFVYQILPKMRSCVIKSCQWCLFGLPYHAHGDWFVIRSCPWCLAALSYPALDVELLIRCCPWCLCILSDHAHDAELFYDSIPMMLTLISYKAIDA